MPPLVFLGLLLLAAPVRADPVERWVAAGEMAAVARAERDAVLLAAAARQMALAQAEDASLSRAQTHAAALLEEAQAIAGKDPVALAVVERYAGLVVRGSSGGTALQTLRLAPGAESLVVRTFRAGQSAIVYSEGPGPFRLSVENGGASPVCQKMLGGGAALCRWVPAETGSVTVRLTNAGQQPQQLTLITN